jgi:hypothetical protein
MNLLEDVEKVVRNEHSSHEDLIEAAKKILFAESEVRQARRMMKGQLPSQFGLRLRYIPVTVLVGAKKMEENFSPIDAVKLIRTVEHLKWATEHGR